MGIFIPVINAIFTIFYALLFARIILSWIRPDPYNPTWGKIITLIYNLTEPILAPIRNLLPSMGGLDLSPLIVFFVARFLQGLLINFLV